MCVTLSFIALLAPLPMAVFIVHGLVNGLVGCYQPTLDVLNALTVSWTIPDTSLHLFLCLINSMIMVRGGRSYRRRGRSCKDLGFLSAYIFFKTKKKSEL